MLRKAVSCEGRAVEQDRVAEEDRVQERGRGGETISEARREVVFVVCGILWSRLVSTHWVHSHASGNVGTEKGLTE